MFLFSVKHDIGLLICVTAINPFAADASNKWCEIAESFIHRRKEMQGGDISHVVLFQDRRPRKTVPV